MTNDNRARISISVIFASYLIYTIAVLLCDWLDLICYIFDWPQVSVVSRIIVLAICAGLVYCIRTKFQIVKTQRNWEYCVGIAIILAVGIIKAIVPDISTDVMNYHLIAQTPGFMHNFTYNLAPGDFQLYGFRLPDRLFFLPRMVLGYRMGTIWGSIVLIIIYTQVYEILQILFKEPKNRFMLIKGKFSSIVTQIMIAVIAFAIVITHDASLQFGTYMVDLFGIPFALEMLRILVEDAPGNNRKHVYFALLSGLLFCMKMTNIVFLVPLLGVYLYRYRKQITLKRFVACLIIAILPVCVYLIYNFAETGNPVFPYYNKIFRSAYFGMENFKDRRWGPDTLKNYFLWPIYLLLRPNYRQSEIPNKWAIGGIGIWIAAIWALITIVPHRKTPELTRKIKQTKTLCIVFSVSYVLWICTTGHIRYFILGYMMGGMLLAQFVIECLVARRLYMKYISMGLLMCFIVGPAIYIDSDIKGNEWSWRSLDQYHENWSKVFYDHRFADVNQSNKIDAFLMNYTSKGSFAFQINPNVPIIYNTYVHNRLDGVEQEKALHRIDSMFDGGLSVYDLIYPMAEDFDEYVEKLDQDGIKLSDLEWLDGHLAGKDNMILVKLGKLDRDSGNVYCYASVEGRDTLYIDPQSSDIDIELVGGLLDNFGWFDQAINRAELMVTISDDSTIIKQDTIEITEEKFLELRYSLHLEAIKELKIDFTITDGEGNRRNSIEPYHFAVFPTSIKNCTVSMDENER